LFLHAGPQLALRQFRQDMKLELAQSYKAAEGKNPGPLFSATGMAY
jgi:hypothetical protein